MICAEVTPKLELMADDELTSEQAAQILAHIDSCPTCNDQWYALLALRQAIKQRAESFQSSPDFETRLLKAIHDQSAEDVQQVPVLKEKRVASSGKNDSPKSMTGYFLALAAVFLAVLIVGSVYFSVDKKQQLADKKVTMAKAPPVVAQIIAPVLAPASLDDALTNFDQYLKTGSKATSGGTQLATLSNQIGFTVKKMDLGGFKLASAQIVSTGVGKANLVRLCYTRTKGKQNDSIICYQAAGGKLNAPGLNEHLIDGKKICCGEKLDKSIVYIPGSASEVLLLSTISKSDLMDLVLSSS